MENETPPFRYSLCIPIGPSYRAVFSEQDRVRMHCRTSSGGMLDFQNRRVRIGNVWLPSDRGALPALRSDAEARGLK